MPESSSIDRSQKLIKTLAGGAFWITLGMFISRILGYAIRAAIAHFYGVESYGIINTAQSLMMIFAIFSLAGLNTGLPRQLSFYRARGEFHISGKQAFSAFKLGSVFGLLGGALLFFFADKLATDLFRMAKLGIYIKIFAIGVPLFVLVELNTSIFKGLKQISRFTFYHDILRFALIFFIIIILGIIQGEFLWVCWTYPFTYFLIIFITFFIIIRKMNLFSRDKLSFTRTDKELLWFSVPVMLSGIFWVLLPRTDTIIIGGFLDQESVGLYNAAVPIGQLILIVRQAFSPIILPLFTELISKNEKEQLSLLYYISAKWTMIIALPIFIPMIFLSRFFIWFVFGREFLAAAPILQIVVIGYFIHTIVGPTSNLLIISGKTRQNMINSLVAFFVSICLNVILIPRLHLLGAAFASLSAYLVFNVLCFIQVCKELKVQPFRWLHLKFILAGILPIPILLSSSVFKSDAISIIIYGLFYLLLLIVFKVFKAEDKLIFEIVMKRLRRKTVMDNLD
ncbi:MAG: flippase [Calditrichia bacterium]